MFRHMYGALTASLLALSLVASGPSASSARGLRAHFLIARASLAGPQAGTPAEQAGKGIRKLRLTFLPPTPPAGRLPDPEKALRDAQPLIRYLETATRAEIELTISKNYAAAAESMANNEVDIANLGGLEYVQASARAGVKPLVQRKEDQNWHTVFITQPDSKINRLSDLNGHSLAFGSITSVSGHVMPEYYLRDAKVDTKVIEKAVYTGAHDATALAVAGSKADAGAMDPRWLQAMIRNGKVSDREVRVFWTSAPYADSVWAARKDLDPKLAESFASVLLKLDAKNPEDKAILEFLQAAKYVRAKDSDYAKLRQAAKIAGLMK